MKAGTLKSVLALVIVISTGSRTGAQEPNALTWQDCIARAARQNPDLLSALRSEEAGQAQYRGSFNNILPHLSLTNSYTDSNRTTVSGLTTSNSGSWQAQAGASLDVFNVADWASIGTASANYVQAQAALKSSSAVVLLNLYKAFSGLLYAQDQTSVAEDIHSLWKTNAEMIGLRYNSGRESKGNKMRTDAQLLQAESDLAQASRDLRVAQQALGQVLGENQFQTLAVTGTWTRGSLSSEPPDLERWVDRSPRVWVQQAVVEQAKASLQNAHSALWPSLSLNYNRGYQSNSEFPTDNPYWVFTGQVSYPLFGSGPTATYDASAAAQRNLEKAGEDLRSLRHQVRSDLESAWSALAQAQDQVRVQRAFLEAARQRRKESDIRYQSGLMPFEEWQLVVVDLVNFEKSYLRSEQTLVLSEAQWRFAKGEQLGEKQ